MQTVSMQTASLQTAELKAAHDSPPPRAPARTANAAESSPAFRLRHWLTGCPIKLRDVPWCLAELVQPSSIRAKAQA